MEKVIGLPPLEDLHLTTTPEALAQRITAQTAQDTVLLRIDAPVGGRERPRIRRLEPGAAVRACLVLGFLTPAEHPQLLTFVRVSLIP